MSPTASGIYGATLGIKMQRKIGQTCREIHLKQSKVYKDKAAFRFIDAGPVPLATFDGSSEEYLNEASGKRKAQGTMTENGKVRPDTCTLRLRVEHLGYVCRQGAVHTSHSLRHTPGRSGHQNSHAERSYMQRKAYKTNKA